MKVFIAGICGTFMAGVAQIAREIGHDVEGCDDNIYPPMSDVLREAGVEIKQGYAPENIPPDTDCVIIGNALSRGNPLVEYVLNQRIPYDSGPGWLSHQILRQKKVIAVAGTHGKTTTASMIAWICAHQGLKPGYLIGGKPGNFDQTARVGDSEYFIIEADEYDTAFFDKRSKFVHYCPRVAVLNNLEFDHADIFDNLDQIQRQFHHFMRILPGEGYVVYNQRDAAINEVLEMGCWSRRIPFSVADNQPGWSAAATKTDGSQFTLAHDGRLVGTISWQCIGQHNIDNALAAVAAVAQIGISAANACEALDSFIPSARRLQHLFYSEKYDLYEDFAHHPTAISKTLEALRHRHPDSHLIAIVEPRSNTMRMGYHRQALVEAFDLADEVYIYSSDELPWYGDVRPSHTPIRYTRDLDEILAGIAKSPRPPTTVAAMSNGSFDGIPKKLQNWMAGDSCFV